MAVHANTVETYDVSTIREDLAQAYSMISPKETPFQTLAGVGEPCTQPYTEWSVVSLANPDANNRVIEGDDTPAVDAATLGNRLGNYNQLSDKLVSISSTAQASDGAANNVQRMAEQVTLKLAEIKRDMEVMALSNIAAAGGSSGNARAAAGFPAFLRSNIVLGGGGSAPTLSGGTEGYPNAAVTPGSTSVFAEDDLNDVIHSAWEEGGRPTTIMLNGNNKRVLSQTFTGNSTRYKDAIDKRLVAAIDIYDSDFGELTAVPNPHQPTIASSTYAVYLIDPNMVSIRFLQPMKNEPIAKTGHADRRLISCEWTVMVDNEAAHGAVLATNGQMPSP